MHIPQVIQHPHILEEYIAITNPGSFATPSGISSDAILRHHRGPNEFQAVELGSHLEGRLAMSWDTDRIPREGQVVIPSGYFVMANGWIYIICIQ